ncbi:MAG: hypothetical protein GY696_11400, partial [Gammaproteobacteria bacterium]|nr:hypothetical protein [Gammaproteobacteria bacterium]
MDLSTKSLPDSTENLKEMVIKLQQDLAQEKAKNKHQSDYILQLVEAIRLARHQHFGRRSEKLDPDTGQLSLLFNEAETLADHESKDKG